MPATASDKLRSLAHQPKAHHAAIGIAGHVDALRIGYTCVHEVPDQIADERDIIDSAGHRGGHWASIVPLSRDPVGIDSHQAFAINEWLKTHALHRDLRIEQRAMEDKDGRARVQRWRHRQDVFALKPPNDSR